MLERRAEFEREYEQLLERLADPAIASDQREMRIVARRHKELEGIVRTMRDLEAAGEDLAAARDLQRESVGSERDLARGEVETAEARFAELEDHLASLMLPRDPNDGRNVIVAVRG